MNEYHIFKLAFDRGIVMKSGYKSPDGRTDIKTERREKGTFLIFVLFAVLLTVCSSKQKEATHNETMIIKPSEFSEETKDLILEKAKFEDWETMYKNVWSRSEAKTVYAMASDRE